MHPRNLWTASSLIAIFLLGNAGATPPAIGSGHYLGEGIIILSGGGAGIAPIIAENGAAVCQDSDSDTHPDHGIGGVCIPFGDLQGDSVLVKDDDPAIGTDVVFQVCIDLDGNNFCGGPLANNQGCTDVIYFSHRTFDGVNFNPLWVDPVSSHQAFQSCGSGGFPGYIVITCAGVHSNGSLGGTHTHHATEGLAKGVFTGGTGKGDFCGSPAALKAYEVV